MLSVFILFYWLDTKGFYRDFLNGLIDPMSLEITQRQSRYSQHQVPHFTYWLCIHYTIQYDISRLWHPNPIKVTKENWSSRRAGNVSFSFFFSFFLNFHVLVDSPLGSRRSTGAFNKRKIQKIRRSDTQRRSNGRTAKIWNLQAVVIS